MKRIMANIRTDFITGMAAILPIFVTVLVVRFIFDLVNTFVLNPTVNFLQAYFTWARPDYLAYTVKFVVFLAVLALIALLGFATRALLVRRLLKFGDNMLLKIPFVSKIYGAMHQIASTFLLKRKTVFERVVLVEYPRKGVYSIGLVTDESEGEVQHKTAQKLINVFIPTTPNPTSGYLLMVPKEEVINLEMTVEEGLKLVISGGAITPMYVPKEGSR